MNHPNAQRPDLVPGGPGVSPIGASRPPAPMPEVRESIVGYAFGDSSLILGASFVVFLGSLLLGFPIFAIVAIGGMILAGITLVRHRP